MYVDLIYIDYIDVCVYGYLINLYFMFVYYMYYFGDEVINMVGLMRVIENVGSFEGVVVLGVMFWNGMLYFNVIGNFIMYLLVVYLVDYFKVLIKFLKIYYGLVVGVMNRLVYYEFDFINNI